jgi:hypothetical protein
LRLDATHGVSPGLDRRTLVDRFAFEAETYRSKVEIHENVTVSSILIPFFLHMYYSSKKRRFKAILCLRESMTRCELLELDKESVYLELDIAEQKLRRKVFWLLFITERRNSMQSGMATILRNSIELPNPEDDKDPVRFMGFLSLARLFVAVEGTLVGSAANGPNSAHLGSETFAQLQRQLRRSPQIPANSNEVQRTDICVTQHWMRMLVWQAAMKQITMTTGSTDDPLSLTCLAHVARDSLGFLSSVSLESVIAHGPGMEAKIFEIANTLLDVINCVPSLTTSGSPLMTQGPRDIFHGLSRLLVSLSGGQLNLVSLLQGKIASSPAPFQPIPRLIELNDGFTIGPSSREYVLNSPLGLEHVPPSLPSAGSNIINDHHLQAQESDSAPGGWSDLTTPSLSANFNPYFQTETRLPTTSLMNESDLVAQPTWISG